MGVVGDLLNRILKTASRDIDLRHYSRGIEDYDTNERRPLRVGIDVSGWIARATHGHGGMLVDERHLTNYGKAQLLLADQDPFEFTSAQNRISYIQTCGKYVLDRILSFQETTEAQILVVFDGKSPPLKLNESARRYAKKMAAVTQRDKYGGDTAARLKAARRTGAGSSYAAIIEELMINLRLQNIAFLVSPYEADGQLALLSECGMVDIVLTEDSDLIAHGVRSILYKEEGGRGKLVQRRDLGAMELVNKSLSLMDFSDCMLAVLFACLGCDYCDSLKMIGSVTARDIVATAFHSTPQDTRPPLAKVFGMLYNRTNQKLTADEKEEYENNFMAALLMLRHPVVFDPREAKCVVFRDPPLCSDRELTAYEPYRRLCHNKQKQEEILGEDFPIELQCMIAEGYIDPRTMRPYPNTVIPLEMHDAWRAWDASQSPSPRKRQKVAHQQHSQLSQSDQQQDDLVLVDGAGAQAPDVVLNTSTDVMEGPETQDDHSYLTDASQSQVDDSQYLQTQDPTSLLDDSQYLQTQDIDSPKKGAPPMEQLSQDSSRPPTTPESRGRTPKRQGALEVVDDELSAALDFSQGSSRTSELLLRGVTPRNDVDLTTTLTTGSDILSSPRADGINLTGSSSDKTLTQSSNQSQLSADVRSPPLLSNPTPTKLDVP